MVVVIAIIIMLLAMLLPVLLTVKENAKIEETKVFMADLIGGLENYRTTYNGTFPFSDQHTADVRIDESGASSGVTDASYDNLMKILGAEDDSIVTTYNPRGIGFINLRGTDLTYEDSWGEKFYICLNMVGDEDIDASLNTSYNSGAIPGDIGIYSKGGDMTLGTDDDIVSWDR